MCLAGTVYSVCLYLRGLLCVWLVLCTLCVSVPQRFAVCLAGTVYSVCLYLRGLLCVWLVLCTLCVCTLEVCCVSGWYCVLCVSVP